MHGDRTFLEASSVTTPPVAASSPSSIPSSGPLTAAVAPHSAVVATPVEARVTIGSRAAFGTGHDDQLCEVIGLASTGLAAKDKVIPVGPPSFQAAQSDHFSRAAQSSRSTANDVLASDPQAPQAEADAAITAKVSSCMATIQRRRKEYEDQLDSLRDGASEQATTSRWRKYAINKETPMQARSSVSLRPLHADAL